MTVRILSYVERIDLEPLKSGDKKIDETSFTSAELKALKDKPVQSMAGRLALKQASRKAYAKHTGEESPSLNAFEFTQKKHGPTVPASWPSHKMDPTLVTCSISHTSRFAYGLITLEMHDG